MGEISVVARGSEGKGINNRDIGSGQQSQFCMVSQWRFTKQLSPLHMA